MHGIIIDNKHSYYDFRAILTEFDVGYPPEIKITETVPYSNMVYDFSYLYGDKVYGERTLTYELGILLPGRQRRIQLHHKANEIVNWLCSGNGKKQLIDTYSPEYHFMAEVTEISVEYSVGTARIMSVWTADPYRYPNANTSGLLEVL